MFQLYVQIRLNQTREDLRWLGVAPLRDECRANVHIRPTPRQFDDQFTKDLKHFNRGGWPQQWHICCEHILDQEAHSCLQLTTTMAHLLRAHSWSRGALMSTDHNNGTFAASTFLIKKRTHVYNLPDRNVSNFKQEQNTQDCKQNKFAVFECFSCIFKSD